MNRADKIKAGAAAGLIGGGMLAAYIANENNKQQEQVQDIRPSSAIPYEKRKEALDRMYEAAIPPNRLADFTKESLLFDGERQSKAGEFTPKFQRLISEGVITQKEGSWLLFDLPVEVSFSTEPSSKDYVGHPTVYTTTFKFEDGDGVGHTMEITTREAPDDEAAAEIQAAAKEGNMILSFPDAARTMYSIVLWSPEQNTGRYRHETWAQLDTVSLPSTLGLHPVSEISSLDFPEISIAYRLSKNAGSDEGIFEVLTDAGAYVDDAGRLFLPTGRARAQLSGTDIPPVEIGEGWVDPDNRVRRNVRLNFPSSDNSELVSISLTVPDYEPSEIEDFFSLTGAIVIESGETMNSFDHVIIQDGPFKGYLAYVDFTHVDHKSIQ